MIGVVDYEAGNIASVSNALKSIGVEFIVSSEQSVLERCKGIILPGVGAAPGAAKMLEQRRLTGFLKNPPVPLLGICLGMQLLYESSEEGPAKCIGALSGTVKKFDEKTPKVPHMGWNAVVQTSSDPLFAGIPAKEYFYFAHSYFAPVGGSTIAVTDEGISFASAVHGGKFYGVQFHPEKSGNVGLKLLGNFITLCK